MLLAWAQLRAWRSITQDEPRLLAGKDWSQCRARSNARHGVTKAWMAAPYLVGMSATPRGFESMACKETIANRERELARKGKLVPFPVRRRFIPFEPCLPFFDRFEHAVTFLTRRPNRFILL